MTELSRSEQQAVVEQFLAALRTGQVQDLMDVLAPAVVSLVVEDGRVSRIYAMANPSKLTRVNEPAELARFVVVAVSGGGHGVRR
jgi:hypothetical protein